MKKTTLIGIVLGIAFVVVAGCICGVFPTLTRTPPLRPTATPSRALPTVPAANRDFTIVKVGMSGGTLAGQLKAEAQKARALNRRAFVEFYADWCPPCNAIRDTLAQGDARMVDAFAGTYIIQLDLDEWGNSLSGTGFESAANGIPAYYALGDNGKPTGRIITGDAWGDNIPENMAPPLKAFFQADAP